MALPTGPSRSNYNPPMPPDFDIRRIEVLDNATAAMYRAMDGPSRLRIAFDMFESAWRIISAGVKNRNPSWSDEQVRAEVARRFLDAGD